jgi:hypothetical protein
MGTARPRLPLGLVKVHPPFRCAAPRSTGTKAPTSPATSSPRSPASSPGFGAATASKSPNYSAPSKPPMARICCCAPASAGSPKKPGSAEAGS